MIIDLGALESLSLAESLGDRMDLVGHTLADGSKRVLRVE